MNNTYLSILIVLILLFCTVAIADETTHPVFDTEQAFAVTTDDGIRFMCLITTEGYGFTGESNKWVGFTCAALGRSDIQWQFCKGVNNKPELRCVPPGTKVNGAEAKQPRKGPSIRMGPAVAI